MYKFGHSNDVKLKKMPDGWEQLPDIETRRPNGWFSSLFLSSLVFPLASFPGSQKWICSQYLAFVHTQRQRSMEAAIKVIEEE
jgi:hypothetical protein